MIFDLQSMSLAFFATLYYVYAQNAIISLEYIQFCPKILLFRTPKAEIQ